MRIRDRLAGQHILITGSTGFLAKAFVEKLLRCVDTVGGIYLLVRPRSDGHDADRRVRREVLGSRAFDRLRASLGEEFNQLCGEKIHVVAGDLTREHLGVEAEQYHELTQRITVVVNCAATVTFDERLDWAVELNTFGPQRLLSFARDCGEVPFMHVSTCYVAGQRTGEVQEDFSAPPQAERTLPRLDGSDAFDLDGLVEQLRVDAARIRDQQGADSEACRRALIDAGMDWARKFGWNDTYTFTKWIGEQLLRREHGEVPVVVFRPAIIEGAYEEPAPGWIDGLRMADPIIVAYGRGKMNRFPARTDVPIDLIPADFVVNGMLSTMPTRETAPKGALEVYQCGSSYRRPLMLGRMVDALIEAFRLRPMHDDNGLPITKIGLLAPAHREDFVRMWQRKQKLLRLYRRFLLSLDKNSRRARRLASADRQIDQALYFAKIYSPYTHLDCRFRDDNLHRAMQLLHADDVDTFAYDLSAVDWRDYLVNRHVPGIRSFVLGSSFAPNPRILGTERVEATFGPDGESLHGENIFEVFSRSVERMPEKPALQLRRNNRWVRYSYREAFDATAAIMKRLHERGLRAGDRVAICGDNGPEWGLSYLALMRAGMTAVPLDQQLPAPDAWSATRFVDAKLMLATPSTREKLEDARRESDAPLVVMRAPFIPPPGASRDVDEPAEPVDDQCVASILFTSGTTVGPKAVQLTHRNFIANAASLVRVHPVYATDEFLSVLPLYHAFEFTSGFFVPLASGATITFVDQLKGPEIVAAMKATGTTVMLVVPRLLQMFHDSIQQSVAGKGTLTKTAFGGLQTLSRLLGHRYAHVFFRSIHREFGGRIRVFFSGASRLDPEVARSFSELGFLVCEGYGMTETAPVLSVNPPHRIKIGSVGRALPGVDLEIRGTNLEGVGEIWVRGNNVMRGYLNNREATDEILQDGWLRTGDLGWLDSDQYLYITGRSKDLIVTSAGKNVYPDEVEFAYRDLPYCTEFCVLAMPCPDGVGDAVHAVVVLDEESDLGVDRVSMEREIRLAAQSIGEQLPSHQRISRFHFWTRELPKTTTLKAKRNLIRDMLLAEDGYADSQSSSSGDASSATTAEISLAGCKDSPAFGAIRLILARQSGKEAETIRPDMNLVLDLNIDSIGKIDVIGQVEAEFNMTIDNTKAAQISRVVDLVNVVGTRKPVSSPRRDPGAWRKRVVTSSNNGGHGGNGKVPAPVLPLRWLVRGTLGLFMHTYVRVQVEGRDNIPRKGAFIIVPNHTSHLDAPAVVTAIGNRRRLWVAGAEDYFFNTALKRVVFGKCLDTISFDRQADGLQGLRRCGEALAKGDGLLLFPEGTRSLTGTVQPFKIGAAVLAAERKAPLIPVHIGHAFDLMPKGRHIAAPGVVRVSFGHPITPPPLEDVEDHYAVYRELTEQAHHAVMRLGQESAS